MGKVCTNCRMDKEIVEFYKHKSTKDGFQTICKKCDKAKQKDYRKTRDGLATNIYSGQRGSSKTRGHKLPNYTKAEFVEWLFSQTIFEELYTNWVNSGYDTKLIPSCDRLDDYKSYTLDNIRLVTWQENDSRGHSDRKAGINTKHSKAVLQYTKDGNFIAEYVSTLDASRQTGVSQGNISSCCNGYKRYSHAGGFVWRFKEIG